MNLAVLSVIAFAVAIIISCVSEINVGFLSIAFAFIIGVGLGGMKATDVAAGFPTSLFLILVGVTLFFSQANVNGTLHKIAKHSVKLARGNVGISSKHTLAIINRGGGTAREVLELVRKIQDAVRAKFGVELHPEPVFVGSDLRSSVFYGS